MEQIETRDQQYLRILTSGIRGKEDYEAAKYLRDKGYANAPVRISYQRDSYGQILDVVWRGPTADGFDFIEVLKEKLRPAQPIKYTLTDTNTNTHQNQKLNPLKNFLIPVVIGVTVFIIGQIITHFNLLGFRLK